MLPLFSLMVSLSLASELPVQKVFLEKGMSETLKVKGLTRVAVANSKVLKAKALPPDRVLITGVKKGETMVRVWTSSNVETAYRVTVTGENTRIPTSATGREGVVKVALEFLELDFALSQSSGIRWPETVQFSALSQLQGDTNMSGLNYSVSFASAKGWVNHLVKEGWAKIVANPELYVRLGEEANFHSGGEFPVSTSSENYGKTHRHVEWKPWGLTAKVRPVSEDELHFSSDITLEISEVNLAQAVDGIPGLTRRRLVTKMNSMDGETVILSGLLKQSSSSEKAGLPVLGSIPVLGSLLFGAKSKGGEETELLMSVTFSMSTKARETDRIERLQNRLKAMEE